MSKEAEEKEAVSYTPGPWAVFEHRDSSGLCIGPPYTESYLKGHVRDVCTISGGRRNGVTDQQRTDARLISAAPELLQACQIALSYVENATHDINAAKNAEIIRVALAKATGGA